MTKLRLYQSTPSPCSYLPARTAHHHISDPYITLSPKIYGCLLDIGFRRTGERIHRPNCTQCDQCVSLRVPVAQFIANKNQRRLMKKNKDIEVTIVTSPTPQKYYGLYEQYILTRHPDTESMQNVEDTFQNFLFSRWSQTFAVEFKLPGNELVCVALCDPINQGWSAVYTFYNTEYLSRSLGTYAILSQIDYLRTNNLKYLYLGYWVNDCDKMNYKTSFRPCEGFKNQQWVTLSD